MAIELGVSRSADEGATRAVLSVGGFVDLSTKDAFIAEANHVLEEQGCLILDMSEVEFIDSTGIGALIGLARACEREGLPFAMSAVSPRVQRVLEFMGLGEMWPRE
jgi:anti-anti-sigma factor